MITKLEIVRNFKGIFGDYCDVDVWYNSEEQPIRNTMTPERVELELFKLNMYNKHDIDTIHDFEIFENLLEDWHQRSSRDNNNIE